MPPRHQAKGELLVGEILWLLTMTSQYLQERKTIVIARY